MRSIMSASSASSSSSYVLAVVLLAVLVLVSWVPVSSLSTSATTTRINRKANNKNRDRGRDSKTVLGLSRREPSLEEASSGNNKYRYDVCPNPSESDSDSDPLMDRKEAAFAMMGSLWAAGLLPQAANAVFGEDAKIEMPSVLENMSNRVNKQCLVESLGNRECLAYLDPENKLYQGADVQVLIQRLDLSSQALATIPNLVQERKWSKVIGVLTGPMGSLAQTMDKLTQLNNNNNNNNNNTNLYELQKTVKSDLYAMAGAAERKQADKVLDAHKQATQNLIAYANTLGK